MTLEETREVAEKAFKEGIDLGRKRGVREGSMNAFTAVLRWVERGDTLETIRGKAQDRLRELDPKQETLL